MIRAAFLTAQALLLAALATGVGFYDWRAGLIVGSALGVAVIERQT